MEIISSILVSKNLILGTIHPTKSRGPHSQTVG